MQYLIGAALVIGLLYLLVVYVIIPISGILGIASIVIGVGYALVISIYCFVKSLVRHINPYKTYVDKNTNIPSGLRRSYFFGPGFHQILTTVKDAFAGLMDQSRKITEFRQRQWHRPWYIKMWIWLFYLVALAAIFVFGFAWMSVFSISLAAVVFTGMSLFFIMFTILWAVDRSILAVKSIQSRCANCKRISVVPVFVCPDCGAEHKKLTPGPYGTFRRKCTCNAQLPTTFINGRSKLKAICPYCATEMAASNARQYGLQLIGGVSAGKTTFLAAFWHLYRERLKKLNFVSSDLFPAEAFNELELWYQQGLSSSTTERNANMYSIIHKREKKTGIHETPYQLTIYDIAGEAFANLNSSTQQQQFKYCEGLIFVIDPTATPKDVNEVFASFITEFKGLKGKHSVKLADIPVAVIISKADLYQEEIGLQVFKARGMSDRNGLIREFLQSHKYENVLNLLDGEFSNVQYYSVSAMGHKAISGKPYEPWGVMEPVMWLLSYTDVSFSDIITHIKEVVV